MVIVGRHVNNITINPLEYILDKNGDVMEFNSKKDAVKFLKENGVTDDDIRYFIFKKKGNKNMKTSKVYKRRNKLFRYDYDNALVLWVQKASEEELEDNKEWQKKYGKDLWDINDGYIQIDAVGLSRENWEDKESRDAYLDQWIDEIKEEIDWLSREFGM